MSYEVIRVNPLEYKTEVLNLWTKNHPHLMDLLPKRFAWIYENNPYGPPTSWLLRDNKSNAFIGTTSVIPRTMWINGEKVIAGIAADMMVDKNHRTLGPALMLQRALVSTCEEGQYQFVYGFSPQAASTVQLRAGFTSMGRCIRVLKVLSTERFSNKQKNNLTARLGSGILDTCIKAADFILSAKDLWQAGNLSTEILDSFDYRFDQFWEKVPKQNRVVGEKTAAYLTWRYTISPYNSHKVFTIINQAKDMRGYLIFSIVDQAIHIYDICTPDKIDPLLSLFILYVKKNYPAHSICFMLFEYCSIIPSLTRHLFVKRPDDLTIVTYCKKGFPSLNHTSLSWHLYAGDKDIG